MILVIALTACDPPPDDGLGCERRLAGDGPFAARLTGSAELTVDADGTPAGAFDERLDVWFPEGRRPGARAWISHEVSWPWAAVTAREVTLDESGGASVELSGADGAQFGMRGVLVGPDGGAEIELVRNLAAPLDDRGFGASGRMVLCPTDEAPAAELHAPAPLEGTAGAPHPLSPLSPVFVGATSPWSSAPTIEVFADGARIDVEVDHDVPPAFRPTDAQVVLVRPRMAFPPGRPIELRASGSDVLGRPYVLVDTAIVLETTAVLTDLSFDTPPPDGAIVGAHIEDGALRLGRHPGAAGAHQDRTLVALGEPPASATRLRVSHRLTCAGGASAPSLPRVALVTSDGTASVTELPCADPLDHVFTSLTLDVPGPGPLYFVVDRYVQPNPPQVHPGYTWIVSEIDGLAFE